MAKLSVLDMVQDILSDMNSDEVNSITGSFTDTLESMQVAQIIKSVYNETMARKNWPHLKKLTQLSPLGAAQPTHMSVEDDIKEVIALNYDKRKLGDTKPNFEAVDWMEPDDFLLHTNARNTDKTNFISVVDPSGVAILIRNDQAPAYYTTFDDYHVVFDSYDSAVDTNLQASKTQLRAYVMPTFTLSDDHVPDMPTEMFPTFLAECKSTCFARLKQMVDQKAEQQAARGMRWQSHKSWQINGGWKFPNYGRK